MMDHLIRMLKALADPTRIRIMQLLSGRDELCVCEVVDALETAQYSVSRHLGVLKAAGLVTGWRQGKWMHYALASSLSPRDRDLVMAVCRRAGRQPVMRLDEQRLKRHIRPRKHGEVVTCD